MIPKKLTLKNFMSYGDEPTTLNFEGMHVVCLSGDNGNGKSALLDAMTWALWGKTRASGVAAVTEKSLIRLGATEMEVVFEFQLNEDRFRVVRKRNAGGRTDWQLAQQNEAGTFISLSGGSQRETGAQIIKLLRMQHETFLNSAYLQQGRADEFTRQGPRDRKRILAEILDLNRYDRLESIAKEKSAEYKGQEDELKAEIAHLLREVERRDEYKQGLVEATAGRDTLAEQVKAQEAAQKAAQERVEKLKAAQVAAESAQTEIARIEREIHARIQERGGKETVRREMEHLQAQRQSIKKDYDELQRARTRREELDPKVSEFEAVSRDISGVKSALEVVKTRLQGEFKQAQQSLVHAEKQERDVCQLVENITTLTQEVTEFAQIAETVKRLREQSEVLTSEFADKKQQRENTLTQIKEQVETLAELETAGAKCRLCESDLTGDRRERVLKRQREHLQTLETLRDELTQAGREIKVQRDELKLALEAAETQFATLNTKRTQLETFSLRHRSLCEEMPDLPALRKRVAEEEKRLKTDDFSPAERIRLKTLESRREGLSLVKSEHQIAVETIGRLTGAEKRFLDLQSVDSRYGAVLGEIEGINLVIAEKEAEKESALQKYDGLKKIAAGYPQAVTDAQTAAQNWRNSLDEWNIRVREVERYTENLARLDRATADAKSKETQLKQCTEARQCYEALKIAFGKKGIQTQIIENAALPELQDEANRLLARLSDNNMSVSLETTRSNAAGNANIETLDIIITDDAGTRPYELFSGGEGFRVNFALRIALSRLLSRRSGAKLQTLILDEGFGSQDGKGREKLVEVIEAIKEDFDLILVITHFDELKDSFPQRVEVIKDARGSRIQLL